MTGLLAIIALVQHKPAASDVDWNYVGGDPGNKRFSPLSQINTSNVNKLKVAWTFHTGDAKDNVPIQCTPIVRSGTMYLVTSGHRIVALDAATGGRKWTFDSKNDDSRSGHTRSSRGVAFWSEKKSGAAERILYGTPDGRILSINASDGKPDPVFKTVYLRSELGGSWQHTYVGVSAAPAVYKDLVFVGIATGEDSGAAPGTITAFSIRTGKKVWSFDVLPKSLNPGSNAIAAAGAWSGYTVDDKWGVLFAATGSAAPDFDGSGRPGDNLYSNCVLALDANTGRRLWHFQTVRHDLWDHDNASTPVLCKVTRNSKSIEAVAVVTKSGFCFVLDRKTGKPVYGIRESKAPASTIEGELAAITQPEPLLPKALSRTVFTDREVTDISPEARAAVSSKLKGLLYGKAYLPPSKQGTVVVPGYLGGAPWSGASFDPRSNTLFVNSNDLPAIMSNPANYLFLTDHEGYPGIKPPWGSLTAINLNSGQVRWRKTLGEYKELTRRGVAPTGTPNLGGTLVTSGNLVFVGATCDQTFRAFDSRSGKAMLELALPASAFAAPSTYSVKGKQYVIIAASGGGYAKAFGFDRGPTSDSFVCLTLP
ncbi:MAG TPA: PQQ-binding-like beta-propeller repeat protein [Fimbriimonas sp.]|nr:PQQ-binding-like beta-propeller repeat protein [Fimbriimonas sp.]